MANPDKPHPLADRPRDEDKRPYWKYALHNPYNYSVLGGLAAASLLTGNWWLGVVAAGAETLWMVFAPDSKLLRRFWFDKVHDEKAEGEAGRERERLLGSLEPDDRARVLRLEAKRDEIHRLAQENDSLAKELLGDELRKLDLLTASFDDLVISTRRYVRYLGSVNFDELEAGLRKHQAVVQGTTDEGRRGLAQQNLDVLMKRKEKLTEIRQFVLKAQSQMDLIENTYRLLADQIVTMRSPREMGGQLDELLDGVEAVRSTAREAESMLQAAGS